MIVKEDVLKALSSIEDPDLKKDIVTLGFIKELIINKGSVSFSMELTIAGCPLKNMFKEEATKVVKAIPGVTDVHIVMTSRDANKGVERTGNLKGVKHIVAVASGKGGVGKSTISATLASEFHSKGFKVGLLDIDIYGPSLPTLFNIKDVGVRQENSMILPREHNGLKLMSFGFLMGDAPAIMRGPMVSGYIQQVLTTVDWGELDYLFIDMPPGTGDVHLTISQTIKIDGAVIVTTRSSLSLVDVAKGILMFEKVNVPILGVVENMSHFICDSCDKEHHIFGPERSDLRDRFGIDTLANIPLEGNRATTFSNYRSNSLNSDLMNKVIRELGKLTSIEKDIPTISLTQGGVIFTWKSGVIKEVSNIDLRDSCKCALCVDEYSGEKTLNREDIPKNIHALEASPLGNYAVAVKWSDGHSSSIYSYSTIEAI